MMTLKFCLLQVLDGTVQFHTCQTTLGENENGLVCFNSFSEKPNTSISVSTQYYEDGIAPDLYTVLSGLK
jgi:hypothetical protein